MGVAVPGKHPLEHSRILGAEAAATVDDQNQSDQGLTHIEVVLHQLQPMKPHTFGHLGESIPREVTQTAFVAQLEEIDQLCAPGCGAHSRQTCTLSDYVDSGGFAGVRASREGNFSSQIRGELLRLGRAGQEFHIGIVGHGSPLERKLLTLVYNLGLTAVHIPWGERGKIKGFWIPPQQFSGGPTGTRPWPQGGAKTGPPRPSFAALVM